VNPITSDINEYNGINPHLNSELQPHGWDEFHMFHIAALHTELSRKLRGTGYTVKAVPSLQVRDRDEDSGNWLPPRRLEPDLSIRDPRAAGRPPHGLSEQTKHGTVQMDLPEAMNTEPEDYLFALAIWELAQQVESIEGGKGKPVAWIEVLSPSNKPGGAHYSEYMDKRWAVIRDGQTLVEIDYLHESAPVIDSLPRYKPDKTGSVPAGAKPYTISVIDPRPSDDQPHGQADSFPFGLEEPLPSVFIPLQANRWGITFDFDPAYDLTVAAHFTDEIDYTEQPKRIESYSASDRNRIAARQLTIFAADPAVLNNPMRIEPLPLSFAIEGASQKLDNVLKGIEPLVPPRADDISSEIDL
jgi:hypothetical protein